MSRNYEILFPGIETSIPFTPRGIDLDSVSEVLEAFESTLEAGLYPQDSRLVISTREPSEEERRSALRGLRERLAGS